MVVAPKTRHPQHHRSKRGRLAATSALAVAVLSALTLASLRWWEPQHAQGSGIAGTDAPAVTAAAQQMHLAWWVPPSTAQPQQAPFNTPAPPPAPPDRTLSFQVCKGFAQQRLAILYGLLLAKQLGRAAVLPDVLLDRPVIGQPDGGAASAGASPRTAPFGSFYSVESLQRAAAAHGVIVLTRRSFRQLLAAQENPDNRTARSAPDRVFVSVSEQPPLRDAADVLVDHASAPHLAIDCPVFRVAPASVASPNEAAFTWAVLSALKPAAEAKALIAEQLRRAGGRPFNLLQVKFEPGSNSSGHCKRCVCVCGGASCIEGLAVL